MKILFLLSTIVALKQHSRSRRSDERLEELEAAVNKLQRQVSYLGTGTWLLPQSETEVFEGNGGIPSIIRLGGLFQPLNSPFVHEISIGGISDVYQEVLQPNEEDAKIFTEDSKFILAEVFSSYNIHDHFVITFARNCKAHGAVGWTNTPGGKFYESFKTDTLQKVSTK